MSIDQVSIQGLATDLPPDGLKDQALRVENVMPSSARHVEPRWGVSKVATYKPNSKGRIIIADALPGDEGQGILLACLKAEDAGASDGTFSHRVQGLFAFHPRRIASDYDGVVGFSLSNALYGALASNATVYTYNPQTVNYHSSSLLGLAGSTTDTDPFAQFALGAAVLPPMTLVNSSGTENEYASGILLVLMGHGTVGDEEFEPQAFDLATGALIDFADFTSSSIVALGCTHASSLYSGVFPLQRGRAGYGIWYASPTGTGAIILVYRNGKFDPGSGSTITTRSANIGGTVASVVESGMVCDCSPLSRTSDIVFLVAKGNTSSGEEQLEVVRLALDMKYTATAAADTPSVLLAKEFLASTDYAGPTVRATLQWATRPDTCLRAQQFPVGDPLTTGAGAIAILLGDLAATPTFCLQVTSPRIALLYGPGRYSQGNIALTHQFNATARAHDMCLGNGCIYTCGTASLTGADSAAGTGAKYLLEKYTLWDFTTPAASVAHDGANASGGLGSDNALSANTRVHSIYFDGNRVTVMDESDTQLRCFVYDANLTYIRKFVVSNATKPAAGSRWRGGKAAGAFLSEHY